jgi:phenylpyruvate tautomerase
MLGKPESYVMVRVSAGEAIVFGGTEEPVCHIRLASLGLPEDQTPQYSAALSEIARNHLGVEPARCYVEFVSPARHMWGYNAGTFG